ncbi:CvpA family protein [Acinetobacter rudis]|uniref:CvpA family protein n=1 Tax=Acinetobacter rudis TaxID=632955 RepID=A0AAW8J3W6_9GAMM|nr:CvpA family protein [Acinetobacter rudis]MDQ8934711.1 CvpA family protein [Acinetobacter rudis]MDQ9017208.1 CvpA family protein [Acinetobacter rudis]
MNGLDIAILLILLMGGLNGLRQGFVKALANLLGWVLALILAAKYAVTVAPAMSVLSMDPVVQKIAAFAVIILFVVVLSWILSAFLDSLLKTLKLGPLNRLAGGLFGGVKGLLIVLITMQGLGPWVESSPYWRQSKLVQSLLPYAPLATELSKNVANQALNEIKPASSNTESDRNRTDTTVQATEQTNNGTKNPFY